MEFPSTTRKKRSQSYKNGTWLISSFGFFGSNDKMSFLFLIGLVLLSSCVKDSEEFPEQGKWDFILNQTENFWGIHKTLFKDSQIFLKVRCQPEDMKSPSDIFISWKLRETKCYEEYSNLDLMPIEEQRSFWISYFQSEEKLAILDDYPAPREWGQFRMPQQDRCDSTIHVLEHKSNASESDETGTQIEVSKDASASVLFLHRSTDLPIFTVPDDGVYLLIVKIVAAEDVKFDATVHVEMNTPRGYLSATDWPLLPFYGGMCLMYIVFAIVWLILSFCQWRDLLRIQFWIGAVIFLGMLEMAVFYAEYQSVSSSGTSVTGALLFAEIVSCAKRTLARMLIVIVSIGFGIVKPRLGETLQRIIIVGGLFFILASVESYYRVVHPIVDGTTMNKVLMAQVPLSLLDAGICWWIFQSLLNTTRTLRLRRNLVKLGLYRHFTNTLLFTVICSVAFMVWSIKYLKSANCLRDWKELWIDQAFWHIQFSVILLVIMILWRPTNNNQRYSFSPLIDNPDDEDEEDLVVNESFGNMKLRSSKSSDKLSKHRNNSIEDELRWVEENIPADLAEGDLPGIDSEEELLSTRFELSKMQ